MMKLGKLFQSLLLTSAVVFFVTTPVKSEEVREDIQDKSSRGILRKPKSNSTGAIANNRGIFARKLRKTKLSSSLTSARSTTAIREIPQLSEIENIPKSAEVLVQSPTPSSTPASEVIQVRGVRANPTDKGVEIILETAQGEQLQTTNRTTDNTFTADIPNAQLRLPNGDAFTFRSQKPIAGISEITVTNQDANTVRVTVIGETGVPTVELFDSDEGLIFSFIPAASATQPPPQPETSPQPESEEPASETPPEKPAAETDEPIELVVTDEQDGYFVPEATTGTRTDTPIRDIPFSIQVVPQEVLRDQQVQRVTDALRNVPGVQSEQSPRSIFEFYTIRGFGGFNRNISIDGLQEGGFAGVPIGIGNIESIEVLKGPAGALFSQGAPGGTVNIITKKPLSTPFYNLEASFGNFNTYNGLIDVSGPLDDDKNILYRFNAFGFSSDTFVDYFDIKRYAFAPAVSVRLGENTQLTLQGEVTVFEQPNDRGLPARGTVQSNPNGNIPINRFLGEPSIDYNSIRTTRFGYRLEHNFDRNWQIRNAFRASFRRQYQNSLFYSGLQDDDRTLERGLFISRDQEGEHYILNTDVVGNFKTGSINHKLLVGFDLSTYNDDPGDYRELTLIPIDIFDPVYSRNNVESVIGEFTSPSTITDTYGIYIQDQITLLDNLKLLLGGRFDWVSQKLKDAGEVTSSQKDDAFSPRVGIVYQPIPPISLYASYSRSFNQVVGTAFDQSLFKPERGTQYEVGVKADLSDRLAATLAFFDITRSNVVSTDPDDTLRSIQTGEQRSRGIEFDIQGEILPGWNIIAGYAYTDAKISEDEDPLLEDNQLNNVPKHAFNIWTQYQIQRGSLEGLGFGLGLFYVGEREGDLSNTFRLPSYLRTDAALFYDRGQFRVGLNFRNLFDIRYFETADSDLNVYPGEPFTVLGSVSWRF